MTRATSTQACPVAGLERSSGGSPGHPSIHAGCRFPWKPVRGRILLRGPLEEILEGHLTMQPFLSPKDHCARKRHRRLTAPAGPGGTRSYPMAPRCPAHLGPASPQAPGQQRRFASKIQKYNRSSGLVAQDPTGGRNTVTASARCGGRCYHRRCSSAHPGPPAPMPLFPRLVTPHLHGKGQCLINVTKLSPPCPKQPSCSCQPRDAPRGPAAPRLGGRPRQGGRVAAGHIPTLPVPR